jgi:hypothetical protein
MDRLISKKHSVHLTVIVVLMFILTTLSALIPIFFASAQLLGH